MDISDEQTSINILLADDDNDDRLFFDRALKALSIPTRLRAVEKGEKLMDYLVKNSSQLPDVLFLDFNMPRKNGYECLAEIKLNDKLKQLPVIIYSTSLHDDVADLLYKNGAYYYIRKSNQPELKKILFHVLNLIAEKKFVRPTIDKFVLSLVEI